MTQRRWYRLDSSATAGWAMLPLRLFLGVAFSFAGLSKIADRDFLDDSAATSMHQTLIAVRGSSPIDFLLGPVESHSVLFGALIAIGEVAVGLGVLVGLLTRIAALGGILLAVGLWLTVSWNADPWYTGADIVYAFALTPLAIAGAGALSADGWLARLWAQERSDPDAQAGADGTRRSLLAGALGVTGLLALGGAFLARGSAPRAASGDGPTATPAVATPTPTPTPTPSPTATGATLVAASKVPVGGARKVDDPHDGGATWVLQLEPGSFTAVEATCPHQGCDVAFVSGSQGFVCPCHNSRFASTGARISGIAKSGLKTVKVAESGGQVRLV